MKDERLPARVRNVEYRRNIVPYLLPKAHKSSLHRLATVAADFRLAARLEIPDARPERRERVAHMYEPVVDLRLDGIEARRALVRPAVAREEPPAGDPGYVQELAHLVAPTADAMVVLPAERRPARRAIVPRVVQLAARPLAEVVYDGQPAEVVESCGEDGGDVILSG